MTEHILQSPPPNYMCWQLELNMEEASKIDQNMPQE